MKFTNREMMREVQSEIGYRRFVYAKKVSAGTMKQSEADRKIAIMEQIALQYGLAAEKDDATGRLL